MVTSSTVIAIPAVANVPELTVTLQIVRGASPISVNVTVDVAPLAVYVEEAIGELLDTIP